MALNLAHLDGTNGFRLEGIDAGDQSGTSVAAAGDVNGDNIDDLIIGAIFADADGTLNVGASYVVFGSTAGFAASADLAALDGENGFRLHGIVAGDTSGWSVDGAGDVNGDGIGDLIVGAPTAGNYITGQSYVVFGSDTSSSASLDLAALNGTNGFRIDGISDYGRSGFSIAGAGDVNGDGLGDLIVGAPNADGDGIYDAGASYIIFGSDDGFAASFDLESLDGTNGFRIDGIEDFDNSGYSVAGAGDVNGDGFDDVIVGAPEVGDYDSGTARAGASYVIFGSDADFAASLNLADLDGSNGFKLDGAEAYDRSGLSVAGAGDVNGDGFGDLIVGAPVAGSEEVGESYIIFGSNADFAASLNLADLDGSNGFQLIGADASDQSGFSVSGAGDINDDGFDDLIVGAWLADPDGTPEAGESYVVFGADGGFEASLNLGEINGTKGFRLDGVNASDGSGRSVAAAGDVNGDGVDDLIVGGRYADPDGNLEAGESYVIFGSTELGSANEGPTAADDILVVATFNHADLATDNGAGADRDPDFDDLTITAIDGLPVAPGISVTLTSGLRVTLVSGAEVRFDAPGVALGTKLSDSFAYDVSDGRGASASATATVDFTQNAIALADLDGANGFRVDGADAYDLSGKSVAGAGDLNGDGFDDVIIGAFLADPGGIEDGATGASYVVFGSDDDFPANLDLANLDGSSGLRLDGIEPYDWSGFSVAGAGDVNGDGFDDVIVGAPEVGDYYAGTAGTGASYVIFGSGTGLSSSFDLAALNGANGFRLDGVNPFDASGSSVSGAGDINGDGFDDVIVGAPGVGDADINGDLIGASYVIFGAAGGFSASLDLANLNGTNGFQLDGIDRYDASGTSVAAAGDINGDGLDDLIIGAQFADANGNLQAGQSFVVFGTRASYPAGLSLTDLDGSNGFRLDGVNSSDQSGVSVAAAGDVNGDGIDDLIIGAYGANAVGASYLVFGSDSEFPADFDLSSLDGSNGFRIDGVAAFDYSGFSVAGAGDFNGDGFDDLVVGAKGVDDAGESYLIFGSDASFPESIKLADLDGVIGFRLVGVDASDESGRSVAGAGDVNGDGFDDLIVGAWSADPDDKLDAGESYVILGRSAGSPLTISKTVSFDGEQAGKGVFDTTQGTRESLSIGGGHRAGLVFEDVALPEGAEIQSATLSFTAQGSKGPDTTISVHLYDDPNGIAAGARAVLTDPGFDTFDFVPFAAGGWKDGATIVTPDLSGLLQHLVNGGPGSDGDFDFAFALSAAKGLHEVQPEELGDTVAADLDISYVLPDIA